MHTDLVRLRFRNRTSRPAAWHGGVAGPHSPASYLMSASTLVTSVSSVVSMSKATDAFAYT